MASINVPFDLIFDDFNETPELQAVLNTSHSLWMQSKDREQLRTLAVSDSLLRYLIDNVHMNAKQAAEARNEWISRAMKEGRQ